MKDINDDIAFAIQDNIDKIKSTKPKEAMNSNKNIEEDVLRGNLIEIGYRLEILKNWYAELLPFIKDIKTNIKDISEQTHTNAIYLIFCFAMKTWESFFMLAKNGYYSQSMILIRVIEESLSIIDLFEIDFDNNDFNNINKWFSGKIISHGVCRKAISEDLDKIPGFQDVNHLKMQSDIYSGESQIAHIGYLGVLENISPFSEDFDFNNYTQFRRMKSSIKYAFNKMTTFTITLKTVYLLVLKNEKEHDLINEILTKYDPEINNMSIDDIKI